MNVPARLEKRIINFLGESGRLWLDSLPEIMERCQKKWLLSEFQLCDMSYNYVVKAKSAIHGDVILKICLQSNEFKTEKYALEHLNHQLMCELIDAIDEDHVLLLEALKPGHTLWSVKDVEERLKLSVPLIMSIPTGDLKEHYPHHREWLNKIFAYIEKNISTPHGMEKHMVAVNEWYDHLNVEGNPLMLLHGDLHHGNILKSDDWSVIDPKGVIGYKSLEIGRYMNNQINEEGIDREAVLQMMVKYFSEALQLDKKTVLLSFYIDMVLSTSWFFEDETPDYNFINNRIEVCDWLLEKMN